MDPLTGTLILGKVRGFFKKILTSPWFYVILFLIAVGGGTYFYLQNDKKEAVATAVENHSAQGTIHSFQTKDAVSRATQKIDEQFDAKAAQTSKDYANARSQVEAAPERDAQAPALLIDTLNGLDRMRQDRDGVQVPDTDVPVG